MLFMLIFFLLNCASALWSHNTKEGISWVGIRISLLVFPLAIGSLLISALLRQRILFAFVMATAAGACICLIHAVPLAIMQHDPSLLYNDNLSGIVNLQSIYMAMLVNLALISAAWLYLTGNNSYHKRILLTVIVLLLPVHFLLASRIAILLLYSIFFLYALYTIIVRKKFKQGILLGGGLLVAACLLLLLFPKTLNRFKELGYTKFEYSSMGRESHFNMALTPDQWNGANLRMAVWGCAFTVAKQHPVLGTGLGDKMTELKKQYAVKGFRFGIDTNRNVHNTYLDIAVSLGLLGLLIFIACLGFSLADSIHYRDWPGILFIACLAISIVSETYIDRTIGNTILSFFVSFMAAYKKPAHY